MRRRIGRNTKAAISTVTVTAKGSENASTQVTRSTSAA